MKRLEDADAGSTTLSQDELARFQFFTESRRVFLKQMAVAGALSVTGLPALAHAEETVEATDFSALANELAREERMVVGVLYDPIFKGRETPASLTPQHFQESWGKNPDVRVVLLNANQIRSYSILFTGKMDLLVFPYGAIYPMDAWGFYSAQTYRHFIKKGGAILTTGGVPFSKQAGPAGQVFGENDSVKNELGAGVAGAGSPGSAGGESSLLSVNNDAYERWISKFGIKYYFSKNAPAGARIDTDFLPGLPVFLEGNACRTGIVANNSSPEPVPKPPHGNVFPERYPVRQIIPLMVGTDAYNKPLATNALLVQDYQTGSRQIHFAQETELHPLSPASPHFGAMMGNLLRLLRNKIMVQSVEAEYACYRQGETVSVKAHIASFEKTPKNVSATLQIFAGSTELFKQEDVVQIAPNRIAEIAWKWSPGKFSEDEYLVRLTLRRDGKAISKAENGFVVWNDKVARQGPSVAIEKEYFRIGSEESFVSGTNYYESTRGEVMWFRPDVSRISADLKQMRACGVNFIRPHYHHKKWFRDYLMYQHGYLFPFYKELEDYTNPLPDEKTWRIWDMFIYLCQKYQIVFGGDLFTLVPAEMGDPRGWFGTTETVYDKAKRETQKKFLRLLSQRYKDIPGISWDLFNEPSFIPKDDIVSWAKDLRTVIKRFDPQRLTTIGGPSHLSSATDYDSPHGNPPPDAFNDQGRPWLAQEVYVDKEADDYRFEIDQGESLRRNYMITVRNGLAGICFWSWTRQMRLRQDSFEHHHTCAMEKWDDHLGAHTHDDGTLKLAGLIFKDMSVLMRTVGLSNFDSQSHRVVTSQGEIKVRLDGEDNQKGHTLQHISGDKCFAAIARGSVSWGNKVMVSTGDDAYVYFFTGDGKDFFESQHLFVKCEAPGALLIKRAGQPRSVSLVDVSPLQNTPLGKLSYETAPGGIAITLAPSMDEYWVEIVY